MRTPRLQRIRRRPAPPATVTLFVPGGGIGLDFGPLLHQVELQEVLQDSGVRGKV